MLVPKTLRNEITRLLHTGHLGIAKTINRVKEIIYWREINNNITNRVNACEICLEHRTKQKQEPIIPHDIPDTPWTNVAMDIFHLVSRLYHQLLRYKSVAR